MAPANYRRVGYAPDSGPECTVRFTFHFKLHLRQTFGVSRVMRSFCDCETLERRGVCDTAPDKWRPAGWFSPHLLGGNSKQPVAGERLAGEINLPLPFNEFRFFRRRLRIFMLRVPGEGMQRRGEKMLQTLLLRFSSSSSARRRLNTSSTLSSLRFHAVGWLTHARAVHDSDVPEYFDRQ